MTYFYAVKQLFLHTKVPSERDVLLRFRAIEGCGLSFSEVAHAMLEHRATETTERLSPPWEAVPSYTSLFEVC
jgi:hypothetical protein